MHLDSANRERDHETEGVRTEISSAPPGYGIGEFRCRRPQRVTAAARILRTARIRPRYLRP